MRFSFKSNRPRIQIPMLTDAEKKQAQLVSSMKKAEEEERKVASLATTIAKGLAERGRPKIINSFIKPPASRRSKSVMSTRKNNTTTRSKKHKSADDLLPNQVANDLTRYARAKVKQNTKTASFLDHLHNMPLDVQEEIYSWIDDPKTQHLTRPEISQKDVRNRFERIHLQQLMRDKMLDEWVYAQADDAFDDEETTFSSTYNTSMFKTKYRAATGLPYISHNGKVFAKSFEEFKAKTRIEYSVIGDYIRFRILPKMIIHNTHLDYDGFIVPDTFLDHLEPNPNGGPWYENAFEGRPDLYPEFDDRTRIFVRTHFDQINKRTMNIHLLRFNNMQSKFMIAYLPFY